MVAKDPPPLPVFKSVSLMYLPAHRFFFSAVFLYADVMLVMPVRHLTSQPMFSLISFHLHTMIPSGPLDPQF